MKTIASLCFLYLVLTASFHGIIGIVTNMFGPVALACIAIIALDILNRKNQ